MDETQTIPIGVRPRPVSRGSQILDYLFWLLYTMLGIRLLLVFLGARGTTGFVRFIIGVTAPFYAPFQGIVASPELGDTGMVLAVPILVSIVVYALLHLAIHKLLRLLAYRRTAI